MLEQERQQEMAKMGGARGMPTVTVMRGTLAMYFLCFHLCFKGGFQDSSYVLGFTFY